MTTTIAIADLLPWSAPVRVRTSQGERMLSKATPGPEFWAMWRSSKAELKAAGISVTSKDGSTWEVCWWQPLGASEARQEAKAIEASRATDSDVPLPAPDGMEYLGFQRAGIVFALQREGTLIGDEMGLGKTIQGIGVINASPKISRVLVICPATLKLNWFLELRKWLVRPMTVGIADSKCFPSTDIVIINFDIVHRYPAKLSFFWDLVIIDEAHRLKTPTSRRAVAIFGRKATKAQIAEGKTSTSGISARKRIALTGTPIPNKTVEIFPILNWLDRSAWPSAWNFATRYADAKRTRFGWDTSGSSNLPELQSKLRASIMVRRLKSEVLTELPPKRRQVIEIPAGTLSALVEADNRNTVATEERIASLKLAVSLAAVSDNDAGFASAVKALAEGQRTAFAEGAKAAHDLAVAKAPLVADFVAEQLEDGEKIILFAHHLDVIDIFKRRFGACAVVIDGRVSLSDRQAAVQRFQKDPSCTLFIGGIIPAGVGITLTASSHVVFAEIDWVPGNMTQAEDRAHRIGQTDSVFVQLLVLEGSLDARKCRVLIQKQEVIESALDRKTEVIQAVAETHVSISNAVTVDRKEVDRHAALLTPRQIAAIHRGLQIIAGVCDGATRRDGAGFSGADAYIGHQFANAARLTARQAVLGMKLCMKYRRQLGEDFVEALKSGS